MKKIKIAFSNLRKRFSSSSSSSSAWISNQINGGGGMRLRSMSEESIHKLNDCIQNMNQEVSKLYMECPETDLREDPKLLKLLDGYFTTSEEITKLCESLRTYLENVQNYECKLLNEALQDFEEEKRDYGEASSFRKTLKDLMSFSEFCHSGNDEDDELVKKSIKCHEDIYYMIVELEKMMKDINKKLKRVRLIRAVVAVALSISTIGLVAARLIPSGVIQPLTSYAPSVWKKSTEVLKMKKIVFVSMDSGMRVALKEVEIIVKLVKRLRNVQRLICETAEVAVGKWFPVTEAMVGLEKDKEFMKSTIVDLDRETLQCDDFAKFGRNVARKKIVEFLTPSQRDRKNCSL